MKTIEEKIEDIANKILPCNTLCQHDYCDINFKDCKLYKDICNALTEVAKLQKAIDNSQLPNRYEKALNKQKQILINKACKWLRTATQCGVHPCSGNGFVEDFRKAMEE